MKTLTDVLYICNCRTVFFQSTKNLKLKILCTLGNENCQERQVQGTITN